MHHRCCTAERPRCAILEFLGLPGAPSILPTSPPTKNLFRCVSFTKACWYQQPTMRSVDGNSRCWSLVARPTVKQGEDPRAKQLEVNNRHDAARHNPSPASRCSSNKPKAGSIHNQTQAVVLVHKVSMTGVDELGCRASFHARI